MHHAVVRLSTFTFRTVHTVNCLHNHHLDTPFNMCSSLYLNSYWSVGEIKTFTHFRTKLKAIRKQRSLLQGYNYDVELLPLPPGDTAVHVFHDPLAMVEEVLTGGAVWRRVLPSVQCSRRWRSMSTPPSTWCRTGPSSPWRPTTMRPHYNSLFSCSFHKKRFNVFALLSEVCWGDSLLMWGRVV